MAKLEKLVVGSGGKVSRTVMTVPLTMLYIAPEDDVRDRGTERYLKHFEVIKAGIVQQNGVRDIVSGYRMPTDDHICITDGRTRIKAALECVNEGLLGSDVTPENFFVRVDIGKGGPQDHLATQLRSQNSLPLTPVEQAILVYKCFNLCGNDEKKTADTLSMSVSKVKSSLAIYELPLNVQKYIADGDIKASTVLELSSVLTPDELITRLDESTRQKQEQNTDPGVAKGKGHKNHVTKRDLYIQNLYADGDDKANEKIDTQVQEITEALELQEFDPWVINQILNLCNKEIRRITK